MKLARLVVTDHEAESLKAQILDLSRQNEIGELSPFMTALLGQAIRDGYFPSERSLEEVNRSIIGTVEAYREETGRDTVVLGMSGGIDSALTAAIFKKAGYRVIGVTMPIHQAPEETARGIEAIEALDLEHLHIDLSALYDATLAAQGGLDPALRGEDDDKATRIRRGNIRARLRMVTLYNLAHLHNGFVASTDNLSELGAGFWTLHGDVGDFAPIQSLLKSWEVPYIARLNGVPEATVRAKPTDGLGIDDGDEAQLGCSYLEWDLMTYALATGFVGKSFDGIVGVDGLPLVPIGMKAVERVNDPRAEEVFTAVTSRMGATWFKRRNPLNLPHPLEDRFGLIESIDTDRFVPSCVAGLR